MFCLHVCLCTTYMLGAHGGQKQVSDPMGLELETTPCGCWEVNPGFLHFARTPSDLPVEPSLQLLPKQSSSCITLQRMVTSSFVCLLALDLMHMSTCIHFSPNLWFPVTEY